MINQDNKELPKEEDIQAEKCRKHMHCHCTCHGGGFRGSHVVACCHTCPYCRQSRIKQ